MQAGLGKYCVHLLADYIALAVAPPLTPPTAIGGSMGGISNGNTMQCMEPLSGLPAAALRQGALALYGACSPAEVTTAVTLVAFIYVVVMHMMSYLHAGACKASYEVLVKGPPFGQQTLHACAVMSSVSMARHVIGRSTLHIAKQPDMARHILMPRTSTTTSTNLV